MRPRPEDILRPVCLHHSFTTLPSSSIETSALLDMAPSSMQTSVTSVQCEVKGFIFLMSHNFLNRTYPQQLLLTTTIVVFCSLGSKSENESKNQAPPSSNKQNPKERESKQGSGGPKDQFQVSEKENKKVQGFLRIQWQTKATRLLSKATSKKTRRRRTSSGGLTVWTSAG